MQQDASPDLARTFFGPGLASCCILLQTGAMNNTTEAHKQPTVRQRTLMRATAAERMKRLERKTAQQ